MDLDIFKVDPEALGLTLPSSSKIALFLWSIWHQLNFQSDLAKVRCWLLELVILKMMINLHTQMHDSVQSLYGINFRTYPSLERKNKVLFYFFIGTTRYRADLSGIFCTRRFTKHSINSALSTLILVARICSLPDSPWHSMEINWSNLLNSSFS